MSDTKSGVASDYTDDFGFALVDVLDPLEVTRDGVHFELLADFPNPDATAAYDAGCLVIVDEDSLFLATNYRSKSYMYSKTQDTWRELPDKPPGGSWGDGHSCGIVDSFDGLGKDIVVTGAGGGQTEEVYMFNVDSETWREGDWLSPTVTNAYSVRYQDSFVLVGGVWDSVSSWYDTLLQYIPTENGTWVELPGKLKVAREPAAAIVVDRSIFPPCP